MHTQKDTQIVTQMGALQLISDVLQPRECTATDDLYRVIYAMALQLGEPVFLVSRSCRRRRPRMPPPGLIAAFLPALRR